MASLGASAHMPSAMLSLLALAAITAVMIGPAYGHEHNYKFTGVSTDGTEFPITLPHMLAGGLDGDFGEYADEAATETGINTFINSLGVNARIISGDGVYTIKYLDANGNGITAGMKPYMEIPANTDKIMIVSDALTLRSEHVIDNPIGEFSLDSTIQASSIAHMPSWSIPPNSDVLVRLDQRIAKPSALTFDSSRSVQPSGSVYEPDGSIMLPKIEDAGYVSVSTDGSDTFHHSTDWTSIPIKGSISQYEVRNSSTVSAGVSPLRVQFGCPAPYNVENGATWDIIRVSADWPFTFVNGSVPIAVSQGGDRWHAAFWSGCHSGHGDSLVINRQNVTSNMTISAFHFTDNPFKMHIAGAPAGKYFEIIGVDHEFNEIGIMHSGLVPSNGIITMPYKADSSAASLSGTKIAPGRLLIYNETPVLFGVGHQNNNVNIDANNNQRFSDNVLRDRVIYDIRRYIQVPITQDIEVTSLNLTTPDRLTRTNLDYLERHYAAGTYMQIPVVPGREGFEIRIKGVMPGEDGADDIELEDDTYVRYGDILGAKTLHVVTNERSDFAATVPHEITHANGSLTVRADTIVTTPDTPLKTVFTVSANGSLLLQNTYNVVDPNCPPPPWRDPLSVSVDVYRNGQFHSSKLIGVNSHPAFTGTPSETMTGDRCTGQTVVRAVLYQYPSLVFSGSTTISDFEIGDYVEFYITVTIKGDIDPYTVPAGLVSTGESGYYAGHIHLNAASVRVGH